MAIKPVDQFLQEAMYSRTLGNILTLLERKHFDDKQDSKTSKGIVEFMRILLMISKQTERKLPMISIAPKGEC